MRIPHRLICAILLIVLVGCGSSKSGTNKQGWSGGSWRVLGHCGIGTMPSIGGATVPLVVSGGVPYVAFVDASHGDSISVMSFASGGWTYLGTPGLSGTNAYSPSLVVSNGVPYVAYTDGDNASRLAVMGFGGGSWQPVGVLGFSTGEASFPSLVDDNGTLYVAYTDRIPGSACGVTVKGFDGTQWVTLGTERFAGCSVSDQMKLAASGGQLYVAYDSFTSGCDGGVCPTSDPGSKLTVAQYDGSAWQTVGTPRFSSVSPLYLALAVDQGIPYVAFEDGGAARKATVMMLQNDWTVVGNAGFGLGNFAQFESMVVYEGSPFVASNGGSIGGFANVMRFDGAGWQSLGAGSISECPTSNESLYFDDGTPYLAFAELGTSLTVMKYE